jgi:hypothetical protein
MNDSRPIEEMTVAEVLRTHPEARQAFQELGIDNCCSAGLTLRQAAERGSILLSQLLDAIGTTRPIVASDSVRIVLAAHPQTFAVFERHGLMGCGGAAGPDERIDLFASIHRIDGDRLLAELNEATRAAAPAPREASTSAAPVYPSFLKAAIYCTLSLGATFGAYNLLVIHWVLGPMPPSHNWVHAAFQLWGFVLLFTMGVSYHTVPRFLGTELRHAAWAPWTLWLTVAGQMLHAWGRLGDLVPGTVPALLAGASIQAAAVVLWAGILGATLRKSRARPELYLAFLLAGTTGWLLAAGFLVAGALQALAESDTDAAVRWNQAVYACALYGGALCWIQGMFLRTGPMFLGLRPPRRIPAAASLALEGAGIALVVTGSLRIGRPGALGIMDVGLLAVALGVAAFAAAVRPFRTASAPLAEGDAVFATMVRMSFAASLLFSALAGYYAIADLAGGASGLIHDGARHALTLGFVTLMIFAMASRILPIFAGVALVRPGWRTAGATLIVAGVLLRQAQVASALFGVAGPMWISGLSGIIAAAGVWLCALSILGTLRAASRASAAAATSAGPAPLSLDTNVAALIGAHEEAIPILIGAGLTPLANPLLRRTMTRMITLRAACEMHGIDGEALLQKLRAACPHQPAMEPPGAPVVLRFRTTSSPAAPGRSR